MKYKFKYENVERIEQIEDKIKPRWESSNRNWIRFCQDLFFTIS